MSAIAAFRKQEENIQHLLRAADVYTQHELAAMRKKPVDHQLISSIVESGGISTLAYSCRMFLTQDEYDGLRQSGRTKKICEEIVLAVYTAVEHYLINKFTEYLRHSLSGQSARMMAAIEKSISFRSLKQIRNNYLSFLAIDLRSFEPGQGGFEESWFRPDTGWRGLEMLSEARNEIAHEGTSKSYPIFYLVDAYSPLDFAARWIELFDCNFDALIYENKRYRLVIEHDQRRDKIKPLSP